MGRVIGLDRLAPERLDSARALYELMPRQRGRQLPLVDGKLTKVGKLGSQFNLDEGQEAARRATLNALAIAKQQLGSLDKVKRVVRLGVHVASATGFNDQSRVANGASELLIGVFEIGRAHV